MMLSKLCLLASSIFSSFRDPSQPAVYSSIPKSRHRRVILSSKQFLMSFIRCHRVTRKMVVQSAIISSLSILLLFFVIYAVVVNNFAFEPQRAEEWAPRPNRRHWKAKHDENFGKQIRSKPWDFNQLVGHYSTTPPCNTRARLLILITSAPENYRKRQSIRETWCSKQEHHQCVFLLGRSNLTKEVVSHQDILQGTFVDSYRNLTLKYSMLFWQFATSCVPRLCAVKLLYLDAAY
ncbi:hypothetical protein CAPTEDRAFT_201985 [Capitella teleta]|uniref:Hexosyltransferase n=1 Tax=Capitella teleta TaxID=283909 RepID=R7V138_CAPTE|nr:hypothetical protein CAPTEDRAFT_201985 [Capitella teleta]|eukprot:ELU09937.1 hypothetical protein CAPTEDRAFT_201985 [Capitella teleta]